MITVKVCDSDRTLDKRSKDYVDGILCVMTFSSVVLSACTV